MDNETPPPLPSEPPDDMIELTDGTFIQCKNLINPGDPSSCHACNICVCHANWELMP